MPTSTPLRSFSDRLSQTPFSFSPISVFISLLFIILFFLAFNGPYIPVLQNLETLRHKALRIIIRPGYTLQETTGDQGTLGNIAAADNHLPGKGDDPVGIVIEVTLHAVHQDGLVHISQISEKFLKHPSEALAVGDVVKVKVLEVDEKKKRISLSIKQAT